MICSHRYIRIEKDVEECVKCKNTIHYDYAKNIKLFINNKGHIYNTRIIYKHKENGIRKA